MKRIQQQQENIYSSEIAVISHARDERACDFSTYNVVANTIDRFYFHLQSFFCIQCD